MPLIIKVVNGVQDAIREGEKIYSGSRQRMKILLCGIAEKQAHSASPQMGASLVKLATLDFSPAEIVQLPIDMLTSLSDKKKIARQIENFRTAKISAKFAAFSHYLTTFSLPWELRAEYADFEYLPDFFIEIGVYFILDHPASTMTVDRIENWPPG